MKVGRKKGRTPYCINREDGILRMLAEGRSSEEMMDEYTITYTTLLTIFHALRKRYNVTETKELIQYYNKAA